MYAFYKRHEYLFVALFVLIAQAPLLFLTNDFYPDTDNYTHARRVLDFLMSKTWAETPYMHSNYPFGEVLHFTRITDLLWILFTLPLMPFMALKDAVFYGGYVYQAGMLVLSALSLVWGAKPLCGPIVRLIGVCLFFVQPSVSETYIFIKPDHHVLVAFLTFLTVGGLIRAVIDKRASAAKTAGIAAALCLWASVEGVLIYYGLLASLALLYVVGRAEIKTISVFCMTAFFTALACLVVNPPFEGFFNPDNGRLSFLTVSAWGLTAVAMAIAAEWDGRGKSATPWRKLSVLTVLAAAFGGLLLAVFSPSVVFAPHFPDIINEIWAKDIAELQPVTKEPLIFFLGAFPSVLALLVGAAVYKICPEKQRAVLVLVAVPLLSLTGLSLTVIRYSRLSSLFSPYVFMAAFSLRADKYVCSERKRGAFLWGIYVLFALYLGANYHSVRYAMGLRRPPFDLVKPYLPAGEGSVLSDTSSGPEIIWKLDEKVIGTPYHRNIEGIVDDYIALFSNNPDEMVAMLKKHRVKAILIYAELPGQPTLFYDMRYRYAFFENADKTDTLMLKIVSNKDLPCGVTEELNTPAPFLLYTVDLSKCSNKAE